MMSNAYHCLKIAVTAVSLLLLIGCQEGDTIITEPPPPEPEPVRVVAAGTCEVEGSSVNCVDASTSAPTGQLMEIEWRIRRGSATVVGSRIDDPGATVSFGPGLAPGVYAVDQTARAHDGTEDSETYTNLQVFP